MPARPIAASITSTRNSAAPSVAATSRAIVVLPVPGRPPNTISGGAFRHAREASDQARAERARDRPTYPSASAGSPVCTPIRTRIGPASRRRRAGYHRAVVGRQRHRERHRSGRQGWLRAAVLGANDGIVSVAAIIVGVAAADSTRAAILTAGAAGLVAGAASMAAGEYVSVSTQADAERADLALERTELSADPVG